MALLQGLPNELFVRIARSLVGRKIDHFDPVAVKDVQSLRLVSQRFNAAAIPTLFENMVLDFSSLKLDHMQRIIRFAKENPGLAIHVRRLQLRTPASTIPFWAPEWCPCPAFVGQIQHLQESGLLSDFGLNHRHSARIHELIVAPLEAQWKIEVHNFDAVRQIMRETTAALPRLHHVENAVSTHESERMATAYQSVWDEMNIDLSWYFPTVAHDQSQTLAQGVSYLMTSLTGTITSLKLREVPFERWLYHWRIPPQIQQLDLELQISQEDGTLEDPVQTRLAVQDWRNQFSTLKRLRTLRLSLSCERLSPNEADWFKMGGPHLYIDDLLTGRELSDESTIDEFEYRIDKGIISKAGVIAANDDDNCTFPHLESLTLFNWPVREHGFLHLATRHKATLRDVEMHRVAFAATPFRITVGGLAESCRRYLPNLTRLVLSKIDLRDGEGESWNCKARFEAGSVYRWDKEGGAGEVLVGYAWDLGKLVEGELGLGSGAVSRVV